MDVIDVRVLSTVMGDGFLGQSVEDLLVEELRRSLVLVSSRLVVAVKIFDDLAEDLLKMFRLDELSDGDFCARNILLALWLIDQFLLVHDHLQHWLSLTVHDLGTSLTKAKHGILERIPKIFSRRAVSTD